MTQTENSTSQQRPFSLGKRMLFGWIIGLLVISFFLIPVREPHPDWGRLWMIRPLIITPLAGAMAGLCNFFIMTYRSAVGVNKVIAVIISILVSFVGLWMGIVLGLDGTLWN